MTTSTTISPRTHAKIANLAAYRVLPALRRCLFGKDLKITPIGYATMLRFAEQIATEGALFLLGIAPGNVVLERYRALSENGLAELAQLADRFATLLAAAILGDRRQANVTGRSFIGGDERILKAAECVWAAFHPTATVNNSIRAAA